MVLEDEDDMSEAKVNFKAYLFSTKSTKTGKFNKF